MENNTIIRFNNYNDFSSINATDIFANPLGIIGEGIASGCSQDSLFGLTDSICGYALPPQTGPVSELVL